MPATLDGADRNGIGHGPRLEAGLDDEQAAKLGKTRMHGHLLIKRRANRAVPPFFA
jgi:hypothetical protein